MASKPPVRKFKGHSGMEVAIWRNESDNGGVWYTLTIKGPSRLVEGEWREKPFSEADLPSLRHLLNRAQQWLDANELNKNVQNGQNSKPQTEEDPTIPS